MKDVRIVKGLVNRSFHKYMYEVFKLGDIMGVTTRAAIGYIPQEEVIEVRHELHTT